MAFYGIGLYEDEDDKFRIRVGRSRNPPKISKTFRVGRRSTYFRPVIRPIKTFSKRGSKGTYKTFGSARLKVGKPVWASRSHQYVRRGPIKFQSMPGRSGNEKFQVFAMIKHHSTTIRSALKHSTREMYPEQEFRYGKGQGAIDKQKIDLNVLLRGPKTADAVMERFHERLKGVKRKIRDDAVFDTEYVITGSPEQLIKKTKKEQLAFFRDSLKWFEKMYGSDNILYAVVHFDEKTPHLHLHMSNFLLQENTKTKEMDLWLSHKKFVKGKNHMRKMHTDFAKEVGERHGFERGIEGSRATHQDLDRYGGLIRYMKRAKEELQRKDLSMEEKIKELQVLDKQAKILIAQMKAEKKTQDKVNEAVKNRNDEDRENMKAQEVEYLHSLEKMKKIQDDLNEKLAEVLEREKSVDKNVELYSRAWKPACEKAEARARKLEDIILKADPAELKEQKMEIQNTRKYRIQGYES